MRGDLRGPGWSMVQRLVPGCPRDQPGCPGSARFREAVSAERDRGGERGNYRPIC